MTFRQQVTALRTAVTADLGDSAQWIAPGGNRDSLALSVIDAIQSTGSHPNSVRNVLARYSEHRAPGDPRSDGTAELLATFEEVGGISNWADRIGNRKPTSTTANAPLKAAAIHAAATVLADLDIASAEDLRRADPDLRERARQAWCGVPGQRSGITWSCLLTHSDVREARADRMVIRYVASTLESTESDFTADEVADLVAGVARRIGVETHLLDHAIWRFETRRHVTEVRANPAA